MSDSLSETVRAALAKATPGPWDVGGPYPSTSVIVMVDPGTFDEPAAYDAVCIIDRKLEGEPDPQARADANLIAHAPEWLAVLCDDNDRLRAVMVQDDSRLLCASAKVSEPPFGCDTADHLADCVLEARAEVASLRAELAERDRECASRLTRDESAFIVGKQAEAEAEVASLRALLREYGRHKDGCPAVVNAIRSAASNLPYETCRCGWAVAEKTLEVDGPGRER
jgi:hypothetical protein